MKNVIKFLTFSLLFAVVLSSCSKDDDNFVNTPVVSLGDYENGILVTAEGGITSGSVSFISNDFSTSETNVFKNVNNEELGVYVQSMSFNGSKAYIVVQNNNVHVVDRYTFVKEATISAGLDLPVYMAFANGKGYITNWGDPMDTTDDYIAVVDLNTNTVVNTISVAEGPEQMVVHNNKLYVSHKGGYNTNNIVSVIDITTSVVSTITVSDVPDIMIINNANELMVLCEGKPDWSGDETPGALVKIDLTTNTVSETWTFANGVHPGQMSYDNGKLYYQANNEVFVMSDSDTTLPTASILNLGSITTYGMAVKNEKLYVTDAKNYQSLSDLIVYDLSTNAVINTFEVGLIASKIYFN